jgi:hypothetical protein
MNRLPTITHFTANVDADDWDRLEEGVGKFVVECLQDTHRGFIAHY